MNERALVTTLAAMLHHGRMAVVARVAAALLAVALSGAPRVAALHAPVERHRCTCAAHSGERDCECALCKKAALAARPSDASSPPCHRAPAARAPSRAGRSAAAEAACVEGTCGSGVLRAVLTPAGIEPFCLPTLASVAPAGAPEVLATACAATPARTAEPETPPPRRS